MKLSKTLYFLRHFPTFLKFFFTNWRFRKYGFRRFRYTLFIEQKEKHGDDWVTTGFKEEAKIIIHADYTDKETMLSIPVPDEIDRPFSSETNLAQTPEEYRIEQLPFVLLQRNHRDIFEACTHLKRKEII